MHRAVLLWRTAHLWRSSCPSWGVSFVRYQFAGCSHRAAVRTSDNLESCAVGRLDRSDLAHVHGGDSRPLGRQIAAGVESSDDDAAAGQGSGIVLGWGDECGVLAAFD